MNIHPTRVKDPVLYQRVLAGLTHHHPTRIKPKDSNPIHPVRIDGGVSTKKQIEGEREFVPPDSETNYLSPSAVPEVDALFTTDNPLIELARNINMSFNPEKVNSGDFGELTDLFIKSAFFNNAAMIQQLPMLFGRSVRLSKFINQLEDDLFDDNKFRFLTGSQKILLLGLVNRAQDDITKGITRNSATIIQGMEVLPKLAAFSEDLAKKKVMEVPEDEDGRAGSILKMIKKAISVKAGERRLGGE